MIYNLYLPEVCNLSIDLTNISWFSNDLRVHKARSDEKDLTHYVEFYIVMKQGEPLRVHASVPNAAAAEPARRAWALFIAAHRQHNGEYLVQP